VQQQSCLPCSASLGGEFLAGLPVGETWLLEAHVTDRILFTASLYYSREGIGSHAGFSAGTWACGRNRIAGQ
jgi:hypothetical protein